MYLYYYHIVSLYYYNMYLYYYHIVLYYYNMYLYYYHIVSLYYYNMYLYYYHTVSFILLYRVSILLSYSVVILLYHVSILLPQGTLQQYVDDLFMTILRVDGSMPPAIKYLFDFLDTAARRHNIVDPEVVHTWKSNR